MLSPFFLRSQVVFSIYSHLLFYVPVRVRFKILPRFVQQNLDKIYQIFFLVRPLTFQALYLRFLKYFSSLLLKFFHVLENILSHFTVYLLPAYESHFYYTSENILNSAAYRALMILQLIDLEILKLFLLQYQRVVKILAGLIFILPKVL